MRYFIIFANFGGISEWGCSETGNISSAIKVENGYPNQDSLNEFVRNALLKDRGFKATQIALTNIIELSKQDYLDFTGDKE